MGLQQLKKQLKQDLKQQDLQRKKSSNRHRWLFAVLVVVVLAVILFPVYRQRQLTASQKLFATGVEQESLGKIDAAEQSYLQLCQRYPQAREAADARLKIGKIWQYDRRDERVALLNYLQLEHDYPDSPLVLVAREEAARIVKYTLRDYSRAIEFYQRLLELDSGVPDQYYYEIADCYFRLENYHQARIELETLLEKYPETSLAPEVLYRRGGAFLLEGQVAAAVQDWQQLIERYPDSQFRLQAEFDLAKLEEEEEHLTEALKRYRQLDGRLKSPVLKEKIRHLQQRIADKKEVL